VRSDLIKKHNSTVFSQVFNLIYHKHFSKIGLYVQIGKIFDHQELYYTERLHSIWMKISYNLVNNPLGNFRAGKVEIADAAEFAGRLVSDSDLWYLVETIIHIDRDTAQRNRERTTK